MEDEIIELNSPEEQGVEFIEKENVYCGDKKEYPKIMTDLELGENVFPKDLGVLFIMQILKK